MAVKNYRIIVINLFEYQNKKTFTGSFQELEDFLDDIWGKREQIGSYRDEEIQRGGGQQFLRFYHKTNELRSNKYVGVIHFAGHRINLLPKLFFDIEREHLQSDVQAIHSHILWWLSYCRKIRFPNYHTSLGDHKSDFFEVLIYLFSKYARELLSSVVHQQYEACEEELLNIKGRINTQAYITDNLSKANWHKVHCIYDTFTVDNTFNRVIKYVSKMLRNVTSVEENKKYLEEIIFILDEVNDVVVTADDCLGIRFNPMLVNFETVRDYCHLFLRNCTSFNYKDDLKLFAFLLPMEYVFEDFVFGFIEKEIPEIKAKSQPISITLDQERNFTLRPDLCLETPYQKIIVDTKYKIIYADENDPKNGISQTDLYQMLAYAVRFKLTDIMLVYPDKMRGYHKQGDTVVVKDELANGIPVNIYIYELPIINREIFHNPLTKELNLNQLFEETKSELVERIRKIFFPLIISLPS